MNYRINFILFFCIITHALCAMEQPSGFQPKSLVDRSIEVDRNTEVSTDVLVNHSTEEIKKHVSKLSLDAVEKLHKNIGLQNPQVINAKGDSSAIIQKNALSHIRAVDANHHIAICGRCFKNPLTAVDISSEKSSEISNTQFIEHITISPDKQHTAVIQGNPARLCLYDISSKMLQTELPACTNSPLLFMDNDTLVFSPEAQTLASYSLKTQEQTPIYHYPPFRDLKLTKVQCKNILYLIIGQYDTLIVVNNAQQAIVKILKEHTDFLYNLNHHQQLIGSCSHDQTARIWDITKGGGECIATLQHSQPVYSIAFSPDNLQCVTGCGPSEYSLHLWNIPTGQQLSKVIMPRVNQNPSWSAPNWLSWSHDGTSLLTGNSWGITFRGNPDDIFIQTKYKILKKIIEKYLEEKKQRKRKCS